MTNDQYETTKGNHQTTLAQHGLVTTFLVYYEFGNEIKWPVLVYYGKKWHLFRENHRVYKNKHQRVLHRQIFFWANSFHNILSWRI